MIKCKKGNPVVTAGIFGALGWCIRDLTTRFIPVAFYSDEPWVLIPKRGTPGSAGYDLATPKTVTIAPGATEIIDLGFKTAFPKRFYLSLQTRSGMSIKKGIVLANGTEGIIDSDYRDTIKLALYNRSDKEVTLHRGTRVAQMVFKPYLRAWWVPSVALSKFLINLPTGRRGGLGSTGTQ